VSAPAGTPARPRQVTLAAYTIMGGSAFVVLLVFETLSNLHTMQTREAVQRFLSEPPGDGLGLTVDGVLTIMRTLGMVAAGCATAAGILGFQVLRRNRAARVALTILAVPLLISGMVTGGFLSSLVAASAFLLWLSPARDWFAGREPAGPARPAAREAGPPAPPPAGPRPMVGFGAPPTPPTPGPHPPAGPTFRILPRPPAVLWACALTWCFAGLGAVVMAVGLGYVALAPDELLSELHAQNPELAEAGLSDRMILAATFVTGGGLIVWALAAMVLAFLLFRGVSWSRLVLMISTGGALGLLGIGALTQLVLMVPFLAAAVTMTLLLRPETAAWVRR
jgi:hypothetical protein